ncbi:MAG: glycosyltransferase family 61 protein [Rhodobacterales bacterium]|nr:glycosyltransferase family 61 protein [Rhodobacterales bacterium]
MTAALPPAVFHDIVVMPGGAIRRDGHRSIDAGPLWPDFDQQTWVRQCYAGRPVDQAPAPPDGPVAVLDRPAVWGAPLRPHFGHLVSELLTRLPWSLQGRPDDAYLFATAPGQRPGPAFQTLAAWFGLASSQILHVTRPVRVATLRVWPQAEQLDHGAPEPAYLDLLDTIAARNGLVPAKAPLLYVTRDGLLARGKGGHAGEHHLVACLSRLGVPVLDPATAPLPDQLAHYAGAGRIVFAEGSALHGRQLLGWRAQQIVVLNRRRGARTAAAALQARCRSLTYVETARDVILAPPHAGRQRPECALSHYDLAALFAAFAALGVDLAPVWDMAAHDAAVAADMAAWSTATARAEVA